MNSELRENPKPSKSRELKKKLAWWLTKFQVETIKNHRPVMITSEDEAVLEKALDGIEDLITSEVIKQTQVYRRTWMPKADAEKEIARGKIEELENFPQAYGKTLRGDKLFHTDPDKYAKKRLAELKKEIGE